MLSHLAQAPARGGPIYCFIVHDSFLNGRVWFTKVFVNFYLVHSWRGLFQPLSPSSDAWPTLVLTFQRKLLADQRAQWQKILLQAFRDSKMILANTSTKDYRLNLYPHLCLLKDAEYIDIMIQVKSKAAELWLTTVFLYHNLVQKHADVSVTPCHLGTALLKLHPANLGTCNHKTQTQTLTVTSAEMHQACLWQQERASSYQIASLVTTSPCLLLRPVRLSFSLSVMVVFF